VWADLLWSPALAFNLFGDLAEDLDLADRAVHAWWPDAPGRVSEVRFAHSPGWLDPSYLGNLMSFHAAFVLDIGDGTRGVIGAEVKYHDRLKREVPKPTRLPRYLEVADRSGAFRPDAIGAVNGTDLLVTWLQHLLVLSMVEHPSGGWSWGRFAIVHAAGNADFAEGTIRYRSGLADGTTFASTTIEALLGSGALPVASVEALRARYIPEGTGR
jgi:PD-(D/E)XK nuclease superfamily protein